MYLLLFVLHDPSKLEDLLDAWENEGVRRVTLLFSTGLGRLRYIKGLRDDLPLIPSLEDLPARRSLQSHAVHGDPGYGRGAKAVARHHCGRGRSLAA
jgi:hypothetical protein